MPKDEIDSSCFVEAYGTGLELTRVTPSPPAGQSQCCLSSNIGFVLSWIPAAKHLKEFGTESQHLTGFVARSICRRSIANERHGSGSPVGCIGAQPWSGFAFIIRCSSEVHGAEVYVSDCSMCNSPMRFN